MALVTLHASDISVLVEVSRSLLLFLKRFVLIMVLLCSKQINESESESRRSRLSLYRIQVSFLSIRNDSVLWGAFVTDKYHAWPQTARCRNHSLMLHSFMQSIIHSFIHAIYHSFIHLCNQTFILHSCNQSFIDSFMQSIIHSLM